MRSCSFIHLPLFFFALALIFVSPVVAEIIPLVGRKIPTTTADADVFKHRFKRQRVDENGSFGNGSIVLYNTKNDNLQYSCNITLGGREYNVIVDTGSSDLFVFGAPPATKDTQLTADLVYGVGSVNGPINTADIVFNSFSVSDQAYVLVKSSKDWPVTTEGTGLLGLGPSSSSVLRRGMKTAAGNPVLDRIFLQNTSTPNFITVLLSRASESPSVQLQEDQQGVLTIGEVVPEYVEVQNMPKLKALTDSVATHWVTLLDSSGIIGPDGKRIQTWTAVQQPQGNSDQLAVMFDTGTSLPMLPSYILNAIYGRVPGAQFLKDRGYWQVPCDYELNVTFVLGGREYPLSPLDLTLPIGQQDGKPVCISYFKETPADSKSFGGYDAILGMAFLRNVYHLINFGDFVDGKNNTVADPYMQFLSTIDKGAAHRDFVNLRLGGKDTTASQPALLPPPPPPPAPSERPPNRAASSAIDIHINAWFTVFTSISNKKFVEQCVDVALMLPAAALQRLLPTTMTVSTPVNPDSGARSPSSSPVPEGTQGELEMLLMGLANALYNLGATVINDSTKDAASQTQSGQAPMKQLGPKVNDVIKHLANIEDLAAQTQTMVPMQILNDIDNSKNPMNVTRERLERAATENQFMNGKITALSSYRTLLNAELCQHFPELKEYLEPPSQ
ncbi:aspartic peptidase a1 [Moniliophthora roreri]|nr:aspartic peptidase a1 [Moniliophthora roreri]